MPPVYSMTINFDSHITKIEQYLSATSASAVETFTTSGGVITKTGNMDIYLKPYFEDGYMIDNATITVDGNTTALSLYDNSDKYHILSPDNNSVINFTSKQATPTKIKIKFKDTITLTIFTSYISFSVGNNYYSAMRCYTSGKLEYKDASDDWITVYSNGAWVNSSYKIISITPSGTEYNAFITAMKDNIDGVLLESGEYKWIDEPSISSVPSLLAQEFTFSFSGNNCRGIITIYNSDTYQFINYISTADEALQAYNGTTKEWTSDSYKTITTTTDQYVSYDFYNYAILSNQLVKQGDTPLPSKIGVLTLFNPTKNITVTINGLKIYNIITQLSNITASADNANVIVQNKGVILNFTANEGYELPVGVELTNITSYNWNKDTGKLVLSKPTGDVTITMVGVSKTFTITPTLINAVASEDNPDTITKGVTATLQFTANTGYVLPTSIIVNGATYSWTLSNSSTVGTLLLSNPTSNVTFTITASSATPKLATPTNINVTDSTLYWDEVENAQNYDVYVDNTLYVNTTGEQKLVTVKDGANLAGGVDTGIFIAYDADVATQGKWDYKKVGNTAGVGDVTNYEMNKFSYVSNTTISSTVSTARIEVRYKEKDSVNILTDILSLSTESQTYVFKDTWQDGQSLSNDIEIVVYTEWAD